MRQLITLKQAAIALNISYQRAAELVRLGLLPSIALGRQRRVSPEQLEKFVAEGGKALPGGWKRNAG